VLNPFVEFARDPIGTSLLFAYAAFLLALAAVFVGVTLYGAGRAWETVVWLKREIDRNYSPNPETGGPEAWRLVPGRQALKAMAVAPLWIGATLLVAAALVAALSAFAWVFTTGLAG